MPGAAQTAYARRILAELPPVLREMSPDPAQAAGLLSRLVAAAHDGSAQGAAEDPVAACTVEQRMVLLELVIPAVRRLERESVAELMRGCEAQAKVDGQINLLELAMLETIHRHLGIASGHSKPAKVRHHRFDAVQSEFRLILSALVLMGHESAQDQEAAFASGWLEFGQPSQSRCLRGEIDVASLTEAFRKCEQASNGLRRSLLAACMRASLHDGLFLEAERFFVRAIADAIGSPLPPFPES
jgi:DnaJ-domain-containing protein 1